MGSKSYIYIVDCISTQSCKIRILNLYLYYSCKIYIITLYCLFNTAPTNRLVYYLLGYLSGLMGHPQVRHGPADPVDPAAHLRSGLSSSPWALSAQMSAAAAAGIPGYDLHRSLQGATPSGPHNPYLPPPNPSRAPTPLHPHEDPATASLIAAQRHSYLAAAAAAAESQKRMAAEMHHHALSAAALREAAVRREEHLPPAPSISRGKCR